MTVRKVRFDPHRRRVLILLAAAFFVSVMDSTLLLAALPDIAADLRLSGPGVQWTATVYGVTFSGLLLLSGRIADRYGRRRLFIAGMALRLVAALACGLAVSGEMLIAARALQGVSAAIIAPAALSMLMATFPDGPERNRALGVWGGIGGLGATSGLLAGGVLTDAFGWEWIFFANVPVCAVVLAVASRLLPADRVRDRLGAFDVPGAVTATGALLLLVYGIVTVPETGWTSVRTLSAFAGAVVLGVLFVRIEGRSAAPLVPFRALRSRALIGGNLVILGAGMAVDGMLVTLTAYAQDVRGWPALWFGLLATVMTVTSLVAVMMAQRLVTRYGTRPVAGVGFVLLIAACLGMAAVTAGNGSFLVLVAAQAVFGAGMGAFVAGQIAALSGVAEENSGLAAGISDSAFAIGGALGIAVATSVTLAAAASARTASDVASGVVHGGAAPALAQGQGTAFAAAGLFALAGLAAAITLLPRRVPARPLSAPAAAPLDTMYES